MNARLSRDLLDPDSPGQGKSMFTAKLADEVLRRYGRQWAGRTTVSSRRPSRRPTSRRLRPGPQRRRRSTSRGSPERPQGDDEPDDVVRLAGAGA